MKNQKKKAKSKEIKKFSIRKILFAIILVLLILLVFLNSKSDITFYATKSDTQAYFSMTESENDKEEVIYSLTDKSQKGAITAEDIKNDPAKYYGKVVKTGGEQGNLTEDYEWQIFYSDGTNIYLIAKDYIDLEDAPSKLDSFGNEQKLINEKNDGEGEVLYSKGCQMSTELLNCYKGYIGKSNYAYAEDYKWNFLFCEMYDDNVCDYDAMKCTSYMLDAEIWTQKFSGQFLEGAVEYVIGGPTLEKFCVAYNDYHNSGACSCSNSEEVHCLVLNADSYGYDVEINEDVSRRD